MIDAHFVARQASRLRQGVLVTCGTNGKTTTNNLIADALTCAGMSVICNRVGANMKAGVATCLLDAAHAELAVLEIDELSCKALLPALKPQAVLLLNLFRDQLDRAGEIDSIQSVLATALAATPATTLIFNADDPLCYKVALVCKNPQVTFGISEALCGASDRVPEARFCQMCGHELAYTYKTYAQLGAYSCPRGDFSRPELDVSAADIRLAVDGFSCTIQERARKTKLSVPFGGLYMVYNVTGAFAAAAFAGAQPEDVQEAISAFKPANGRLQRFYVAGREVVLNLAKNPTGFNQNISLMQADASPKVAYFVINDNDNDGRDVSWIYDVDFERLAKDTNLQVYAGGTRARDLIVRLKYADIPATFAQTIHDVLADAQDAHQREDDARPLYVLTNYSALWPKKAELEALAERGDRG